jgi:parvulin-like peptidyl-prolyl isomerase
MRRHAAAPVPSALQQPGASLGGYKTLGGVVAEVNGNPIYANKVLRQLTPELAARAPELDEQQFRALATQEITRRIRDLVRTELVFGAAERTLSDDDRKLAEVLTMQDRTRRITEAGGSIELARRGAQANGDDFDDLVLDIYRQKMADLFRYRKIYPRIQITADDMRSYYNANIQSLFTQQDEVTFRIIQVATRRYPSKSDARQRAQDLLEKANTSDFAELARTANDDPNLARTGGQFTIQRGAYRLEKVEQTLWDTPVDQITPIIEDTGGFYIAKVESRKQGKVMPFESSETQEKIRADLRTRQLQALNEAMEQRLRQPGSAMVRESREMTQTAVDMAMQNYPLWAKANRNPAIPNPESRIQNQ